MANGTANGTDHHDSLLSKVFQGLGHQGDEIGPCYTTGREVGGQLGLDSHLEGVTGDLLLERTDDVDVQGSATARAPVGKEGVRRTRQGAGPYTKRLFRGAKAAD